MAEIITCSFCLLIAVAAYIISYFQFKEKGILFNNAYLYASKEERSKMNKSPHYHQSGVIFSFIGTIFVVIAIQAATKLMILFYLSLVISFAAVIYAIVSSILIEKKK